MTNELQLTAELDALQRRLMELEEIEVMRVTEEQERFNALQVLDEYAKQLEESRDKLARLFRAGAAVQEARTVNEILQRVADAVGEAGWGSVSVTLFRNWDVVESAYFGCSSADIEFLETNRRAPEERAKFYGPDMERFKISRSYFVPAERVPEVVSPETVVPGRRAVQIGDTWNPMDLAYIPLYGGDGQVLGSVNCDDPLDGHRPSAETVFYLELFADLAARKVETTLLLNRQTRTEQALRQSEEKYRTLFNRSGDGFFLMDELFRDCNTKACELWRCDPDDIIGHSPVEFSPEFQPDGRRSTDAAREFIYAAMAGKPQRFYWLHKRKDGDLLDCEVSLAGVEVDNEHLILAIVRDISERKRAELEQEIILRVLQIANAHDDQDQMISMIFAEIGKLVPIENYYLALYDSRTETVSFPYFVDEMDSAPPPMPMNTGLTAWVIRNRQPLRVNDGEFEALERQKGAIARGTPAKSWLGVPMVHQSRTVGALVVQSYKQAGRYDSYHENVLQAVAAQIASIFERKQMEMERQKMATLVESSPDFLVMLRLDGEIIFMNHAAQNICGCDNNSPASPCGFQRLFVDSQDPCIDEMQASVLEHGSWEGESAIHDVRTAGTIPVQMHAFAIRSPGASDPMAIGVIARDLTEFRKSQIALVHLQERLQAVVNNFPIELFTVDRNGVLTLCEGHRLDGIGLQQNAVGESVFKVFENLPDMIAMFRQALQGNTARGMLHLKDRVFEIWLSPVAASDSGDAKVLGVAVDATERYSAEAAMQESEERYRRLVELSPDGIIIHQDDKIVFANKGAAQLAGLADPELLLGKSALNFVHPDHRAIAAERIRQIYEQGGGALALEEKLTAADGTIIHAEITATATRYNGKPAVQVVIRDITRWKTVEAQVKMPRS